MAKKTNPMKPESGATRKSSVKAAKKAAAKKAAGKVTKKAAKKARKATRRSAIRKTSIVVAQAKPDDVATAAYLNYLGRLQKGLPGDELGDWLAAERSLAQTRQVA